MNLVTFFLLTGIVRIIVTAILLKLIDSFLNDFTIVGFWPAFVIALAVAVAGMLIDRSTPTQQMIDSGHVASVLSYLRIV